MNQGSGNTLWYVVGIVVVVALVAWYFLMPKTSAPQQQAALPGQPAAPAQLPVNNTTEAIANDFSQIPDDTAALDQQAMDATKAVNQLQ